MHQHKVKNPPLKTLQGIGIVTLLVLGIVADSLLTSLLIPLIGEAFSSAIFWIAGGALALWTMRRFVLCYTYVMHENQFYISSAYGRYERMMADIYFNNILASGTEAEMRERYPDAKVTRATRPKCPLKPMALACRDNGRAVIFILQPDDYLREKLNEIARNNNK